MKAKSLSAESIRHPLLPHPLSQLVCSTMSELEFSAFCDSIKADGLLMPITLHEGKILDGNTRYAACRKLGIKPEFTEYAGKDPQAFVLDANIHRRQLSAMQRALVAAKLWKATRDTARPPSQVQLAKQCASSEVSVSVAVKLLQWGSTPAIHAVETNAALTREDVLQMLEDAGQISRNAQQAAPSPDDLDDDDVPAPSSNVVKLKPPTTPEGVPVKGARVAHPERKAQETAASAAVQAFKACSEAERKAFVEMAWTWLEPALQAAGKLAKPSKGKPRKAA